MQADNSVIIEKMPDPRYFLDEIIYSERLAIHTLSWEKECSG
jgi:hypothetical protein